MYFERIETSSLAHYSYIIAEDKEMIVIDPQADIDRYLEISRRQGMKITTILETHRNEDFASGSKALSDATEAKVYTAGDEDLNYQYGERIKDGQEIVLSSLKIKAIHTPGHTLGHMSYLLYLKDEQPYILFSGDTLFFGGVGRTDFYGEDRLEEITGYLYESIYEKILALGDHVILCPAHGAGSACGASIEDRPYSTIGYEKKYNKDLRYGSKKDFVKNVSKILYKAPYFEDMEVVNLKGIRAIDCNIDFKIKHVNDIKCGRDNIVDIRKSQSFLGAHIKKSIYVDYSDLSSYLNWFLSTDKDITFITDSQEVDYLNNLYLDMRRIGYNGELSFLADALNAWEKECKDVAKTSYILAKDIKDKSDEIVILDVREKNELEVVKAIDGSINISMQEITSRYEELPEGKTIYVVCASGSRATTVSSFLEKKNIDTCILLGGLNALRSLD